MSGKRSSDSSPGSKFEATPMNRGIPKRSDAKLISAAFARNIFRSCRPRTGANHPRQRRLRQAHDRRKKKQRDGFSAVDENLDTKNTFTVFILFLFLLSSIFILSHSLSLSRSFCLSLSLSLVPPFTLPNFFRLMLRDLSYQAPLLSHPPVLIDVSPTCTLAKQPLPSKPGRELSLLS